MALQIFECAQNTPEWFQARMGLPTASEFHTVMAGGKGLTRAAYMRRLAGEIITGKPEETYNNGAMDRGHAMEDEAFNDYVFTTNATVQRVGFVRNGGVGASPDGLLVGIDGVLEIKTKKPSVFIDEMERYDKLGTPPPEHVAQCQGVLWVTGRSFTDLKIYWPGMPDFTIRIMRDQEYIEKIERAVREFQTHLDEMVERLRHRRAA